MAKKKYVKSRTGETSFEHAFRDCAALMGITYEKIEDVRIDKGRHNRIKTGQYHGNPKAGFEDELRRPYDGIIVSKLGNFPVEFKFNANTLEPHQKQSQEKINRVNGSFFVLRKEIIYISEADNRWKTIYSIQKMIDKKMTTVYSTGRLEEMAKWFIGESGEGDSHISYYVRWLKK